MLGFLFLPPIVDDEKDGRRVVGVPNWCTNALKVSGRLEDLSSFVKENAEEGLTSASLIDAACSLATNEPTAGLIAGVLLESVRGSEADLLLCFGRLLPEPEYENETEWYNWRLNIWGVKWCPRGVRLSLSVDGERFSVTYEFGTAWGPAYGWLFTAGEAYPHLHFSLPWWEEGGYCGILEMFGGEVITDTEETWWDKVEEFYQEEPSQEEPSQVVAEVAELAEVVF